MAVTFMMIDPELQVNVYDDDVQVTALSYDPKTGKWEPGDVINGPLSAAVQTSITDYLEQLNYGL